MFILANLEKLVSLFYKIASYSSKKEILNKYKDNPFYLDIIKTADYYINYYLKNKSNKYWGFIWDNLDISYYNEEDDKDEIEDYLKSAIEKICSLIKRFEAIVKNLKRKDISQYKSYADLQDTVDLYILEKQKDEIEKYNIKKYEKLKQGISPEDVKNSLQSGTSTKIYEDLNYYVFRVNSIEGAHALAKDTPWCIARINDPFFNEYTSDNLIFYFAFDKNRELEDPYQKMAIRVYKNENNIEEIKATRKTNDGDDINPEEVPGWDIFKQYIIQDAEQQPEGLLSKVMNGRGTEDDVDKLWKNNFTASVETKNYLLENIPENLYTQDIKNYLDLLDNNSELIDNIYTNIVVGNVNKYDTATLEAVLRKVSDDSDIDEKVYKNLWKMNNPTIQSLIAKKTKNPAIHAAAALSPFDEVQFYLIANDNISFVIMKQLQKSQFYGVRKAAKSSFGIIAEKDNENSEKEQRFFWELTEDEQVEFLKKSDESLAFLSGLINLERLPEIIIYNPKAVKEILLDQLLGEENNVINKVVSTAIFEIYKSGFDPEINFNYGFFDNINKIINNLSDENKKFFILNDPTVLCAITNQSEEIKKYFIDVISENLEKADLILSSCLKKPFDEAFKYTIDNYPELTEVLKNKISQTSVLNYAISVYPDIFNEYINKEI